TALLDAVESNRIDRHELTAYTVRQLSNLGDARLNRRLEQVWGSVCTTDGQRRRDLERLRRELTSERLAEADLVQGRAVFQRQCANCHRFSGEGGRIGPDLTGAQRTNLEYLLENLVDPSAVVARDYQMHIVETVDGRILTGLIESENEQAVTLLSIN